MENQYTNSVISKELQTENEYGINIQRYYNKGFTCATGSALTNPESITNGLDEAFGLFRQDSVEITRKRVQKFEADIAILNRQKAAKETELKNYESNLGAKERQKEEFIKEKDGLEKKSGITSSLAPLIVLGVSLSLLTLLVFSFYYYVGRATLIPMISGSLGIMQSVELLSVLFPFLALAYGVLIHLFLKPIKQNKSWTRFGYIIALIGVLAVAFWLDAVMGIEMSKQAHIKAFNLGQITTAWQNAMAWSDNHFYIVLILGFVSYLIWGIMLSNFLSHPNFNKPEEIKKLDKKIFNITEEIENIKSDINNVKNDIANIQKDITDKEKDLNNYKSGSSVYYNITFFNMIIGKFMDGYKSYVTGYYRRDEDDLSEDANAARIKAKDIIDKATKKQEEWTNLTIARLQQER
ncbi:MAG: hypothetical protein LBL13_09890 [Bacteroidales bacterium]|jgi:hypothetical protein|nr:hypothetical protein [Bacteroidales bacterium]